ncbi:hypothetical protein O5585_27925 [Escherichia coli]|nr:hypothetical protein [Escherichia coli]
MRITGTENLSVEQLAAEANMSVSAFHHNFMLLRRLSAGRTHNLRGKLTSGAPYFRISGIDCVLSW